MYGKMKEEFDVIWDEYGGVLELKEKLTDNLGKEQTITDFMKKVRVRLYEGDLKKEEAAKEAAAEVERAEAKTKASKEKVTPTPGKKTDETKTVTPEKTTPEVVPTKEEKEDEENSVSYEDDDATGSVEVARWSGGGR